MWVVSIHHIMSSFLDDITIYVCKHHCPHHKQAMNRDCMLVDHPAPWWWWCWWQLWRCQWWWRWWWWWWQWWWRWAGVACWWTIERGLRRAINELLPSRAIWSKWASSTHRSDQRPCLATKTPKVRLLSKRFKNLLIRVVIFPTMSVVEIRGKTRMTKCQARWTCQSQRKNSKVDS